ncbi:phospholipid transporting ATPase-like protein [Trypanosoma grayi]|uniref:phospholipid transporting ATPase-like protein n=1 Tax=Trypanosoma grayi TaxID=71804 RepID=UPI0004F44FEE|nr:phospholipid transporting ATPase-like protein [Trypanosoma grayi]KEG12869.1 phospholipid transporting ATPase-like protein [Trypanosoma grayi]
MPRVSEFCRRLRNRACSCCSCCGTQAEDAESDTNEVPFVEISILRDDLNAERNYPTNSIRTSKYTWASCFPKSLMYQFRKVSNVYFLLVMILSMIPGASPVNPFSSIVPFVIVLGAGIVKDLWEDGKRQKSDRRANEVKAFVLRGSDFVAVPSRDVRVGDVMLCRLGDEVLADSVVLNTSLSDGLTYIETANLDGETNAKTRRAMPQTIAALGTVEDIIEKSLPSYGMRAHFLEHGSLAKWRKAAKDTVVPAPIPDLPKVLPCEPKAEGSPKVLPMPSFPLHDSTDVANEPFPKKDSVTLVKNSSFPPGEAVGPHSHLRANSCAVGEMRWGKSCALHTRQLTLDERFMVGREIPMPRDILGMSRSYEHRHMAQHSRGHFPLGSAGHEMTERANGSGGAASGSTPEEIGMSSSTSTTTEGVVILGAPPCAELYSWIGQLRMHDSDPVPLGVEQLLLRGCVIRNTEWVLCVVVYTGRDTKMLLNLRPKPIKTSVIGRRINFLNLFLLMVHQAVLFLLCGLAVAWRNSRLDAPEGTKSGFSTWYIQWNLARHDGASFVGLLYLTNFVLLSFLIPLSLYVTLEFNKAVQMYLMSCDRRMANFDEFNGELRYSRPKTSELNCQLAHVRYIFTDKTGTLTENVMTYVGGCTASEKHDEQERPGGLGESFLRLLQRQQKVVKRETSTAEDTRRLRPHRLQLDCGFDESLVEEEPVYQYLRALSLCHSVVCFDRPTVDEAAIVTPVGDGGGRSLTYDVNDASLRMRSGEGREMATHARQGSAGMGASISVFHASTVSGVGRLLHGRTGSTSWFATRHSDMQAHQRSATMPQSVNELKDLSKIYEGHSLDEIALVTAARDNLFALQRRTAKHMFVKVVNKMVCYEIIAELEFTPQRKLMSILLIRNPDYDDTAADMQGDASISYHRRSGTSPIQMEPAIAPRGLIKNVLVMHKGNTIDVNSLRVRDEDDEDDEDALKDVRTSGNSVKERCPYLLLVKGADNCMMEIVNQRNPRNAELKPVFQQELESMAQNGLRTLVLGQRYVSEREVRGWLPVFNEAQCSMHDRSEKLHSAYALMEKDIDLVGTTAVEDQLQEGVPETLEFFLQAEIVVWMLTGDKRETAVTIAGTSGIVSPAFEDCVCHLDVADASAAFPSLAAATADPSLRGVLRDQLRKAAAKCDDAERKYDGCRAVVVVVDGRTLDIIFGDDGDTRTFFDIGVRCRSAVCCRMTPLQKAKIVRMFQKNTNTVALAIGDGANDVSMIQESHIGVGIMGLEGSQAELASDYAIPKFRFLKRLLVVHGRFSLYRDAHCIVFSLYKNVTLSAGLIAYTFYQGFSGLLLVDSWLLALFNLFFCSLQPLAIGIFDKDVEDELAESLPALYPALSREQMFFSWRYILKWLFDGVVDGLILFLVIFYTVGQEDDLYPYRGAAVEDYGMLFYMMMLIVLNLRVAALMTCYTAVSTTVIALGFAVIPLLTLAYSAIPNLLGSDWCFNVAKELMGTGRFWLMLLFAGGVFVVYGLAVNAYMALFWPWTNGGGAMKAAWRSPYRREHHGRIQGRH